MVAANSVCSGKSWKKSRRIRVSFHAVSSLDGIGSNHDVAPGFHDFFCCTGSNGQITSDSALFLYEQGHADFRDANRIPSRRCPLATDGPGCLLDVVLSTRSYRPMASGDDGVVLLCHRFCRFIFAGPPLEENERHAWFWISFSFIPSSLADPGGGLRSYGALHPAAKPGRHRLFSSSLGATFCSWPADLPPSDERRYGCRGFFASPSGNQPRDAYGAVRTLFSNRSSVYLSGNRPRLYRVFVAIRSLLVRPKIRVGSLASSNRSAPWHSIPAGRRSRSGRIREYCFWPHVAGQGDRLDSFFAGRSLANLPVSLRPELERLGLAYSFGIAGVGLSNTALYLVPAVIGCSCLSFLGVQLLDREGRDNFWKQFRRYLLLAIPLAYPIAILALLKLNVIPKPIEYTRLWTRNYPVAPTSGFCRRTIRRLRARHCNYDRRASTDR